MVKCDICDQGKPTFGAILQCKKCGFRVCTRHEKELQMKNPLIGGPSMVCPRCNKRIPLKRIA
ncbi:MAG: hypothetical protein JW779_14455 [Candidatus Thorarchaeota archaeon]|nr:hypothetical protein [Candidatus Thorarchaeota archaeon]